MGAPSVGESYYAVLGVARDATPEEVRAAFRAVALDTHPDSGAAGAAAPEAAARFQHAKEAYDVLRRADSRAEYDAALARVEGLAGFGRGRGNAGLGRSVPVRLHACERARESETERESALACAWSFGVHESEHARARACVHMHLTAKRARARACPRACALSDGEWMGPGMRARVDAARRWRAKRDARAQSHAERSASAEAAMGAEEANEAEELLKRFREVSVCRPPAGKAPRVSQCARARACTCVPAQHACARPLVCMRSAGAHMPSS